jgi:hypothetical protein
MLSGGFSMKFFSFLLLIICSVLGSSCLKLNNKIDLFYQTTYPLIISAIDVEKSNLYINTHSPLTRPSSAIINIMGLHIFDQNFNKSKLCIFYKIPNKSKNSLGELRIILVKSDCDNTFDKKPLAEIDKVQELLVHFNNEDTIVDRKRFERSTLYFEIKRNEESKTLNFPLYNYSNKKDVYERYSPSFKNTLLKGMTLSAIGQHLNSSMKKVLENKKIIGKYEDNYLSNNLNVCHSYDKNCQVKIEYKCNECQFGWFNAIPNSKCARVTTKFCGRNRCGEKGMPACIRGYEAAAKMGLEADNGCYEDSPAGYCNSGLKATCDGNHLICL